MSDNATPVGACETPSRRATGACVSSNEDISATRECLVIFCQKLVLTCQVDLKPIDRRACRLRQFWRPVASVKSAPASSRPSRRMAGWQFPPCFGRLISTPPRSACTSALRRRALGEAVASAYMHAGHARCPAGHEFRRQREAGEDQRASIRAATPIRSGTGSRAVGKHASGAALGQDLGEANAKYRVSSPRELRSWRQ